MNLRRLSLASLLLLIVVEVSIAREPGPGAAEHAVIAATGASAWNTTDSGLEAGLSERINRWVECAFSEEEVAGTVMPEQDRVAIELAAGPQAEYAAAEGLAGSLIDVTGDARPLSAITSQQGQAGEGPSAAGAGDRNCPDVSRAAGELAGRLLASGSDPGAPDDAVPAAPAGKVERSVGTASDAALTRAPVDPSMQGIVTIGAEGAVFQSCSESDRLYPIATDGDFAALEHAYLATGQEAGGGILATFDGEFEGEGEDMIVEVTRFIGVWPEVSCEQVMSVSLTNTYWRITSLDGTDISEPKNAREPHLILLSEDMRFSATMGCNQLMGTFEVSGDALSFGDGAASTSMACRSPLAEWEALLSDVITRVAYWQIDRNALSLLDSDGAQLARLTAVSVQ